MEDQWKKERAARRAAPPPDRVSTKAHTRPPPPSTSRPDRNSVRSRSRTGSNSQYRQSHTPRARSRSHSRHAGRPTISPPFPYSYSPFHRLPVMAQNPQQFTQPYNPFLMPQMMMPPGWHMREC